MALPTKAGLLTMDFDFKGEPFVWVEAKALGTLSMDYDFKGEPFAVAAVAPSGFQAAWAVNANSIHGGGVPV